MSPTEIPSPVDHEPIAGPRVRFRPIEERDLPDLLRWLADPEVRRYYGDPPASIAEARADYMEPGVGPCWRFVIELAGRAIGEIQYYHQYAGYQEWAAGIDLLIGEPDARDRGVGTEVVRTMLAYLFETKRLHRVYIDPEVANARAIRCYEKAGFRFEGVLRHHAFEHGEYVDTHLMAILEAEWPEARRRWDVEAARSSPRGSA